MKNLILKVIDTGRKAGKFTYQIFDGERLLCERRSNRVYVAAFVDEIIGEDGSAAGYKDSVK